MIPADQFGILNIHTFLPSFTLLISTVAATLVLVWIGELITENGIGNGVSIIIFGGIVAGLPGGFANLVTGGSSFNLVSIILFAGIGLLTIVGIVLINEGVRKIPVQYARRVRGQKQYGGRRQTIPLRVNSAGMIPLIFAVSIMILPCTIANFLALVRPRLAARTLAAGCGASSIPTTLRIKLATSCWWSASPSSTPWSSSAAEYPGEPAEEGGFVPGIRPGRPTGEYLTRVLEPHHPGGRALPRHRGDPAVHRAGVHGHHAVGLGSTALLIVVGVAIDTMRQLEAQLLMRNYEGFIK